MHRPTPETVIAELTRLRPVTATTPIPVTEAVPRLCDRAVLETVPTPEHTIAELGLTLKRPTPEIENVPLAFLVPVAVTAPTPDTETADRPPFAPEQATDPTPERLRADDPRLRPVNVTDAMPEIEMVVRARLRPVTATVPTPVTVIVVENPT